MKKIIIPLIFCLCFMACKKDKKEIPIKTEASKIESFAPISNKILETAVIYEANIRQYSEEGTFNAFTDDIWILKELGVKIIWVMPINPISKIKRKATGDKFTSEIENEEERKKYLGSYYSVSDYKAINPEFGTIEDFKNLVTTAHENGIYVIIDWVPNHTGWDHPWITSHPDWYTQNDKGEIIDPINPDTGESWGWTDVADLNYDNQNMRKEMINDMKFWVEEADIDGFRMDVAHKVPPAFFNNAITEMEKIKPLFMLAEAEQHELFRNGFDMQYAWEGHHILNKIAKGQASAKEFNEYMVKQDSLLLTEDFNMNFVTNHDENSWNGTLKERMPESKKLFTALTYLMPGMPLIYSGQEYDLAHRLKFFEKDQIPKIKGNYFELLVKLGKLKNTASALNGGKQKASYKSLNLGDAIIAFTRTKNGSEVSFIGNISDKDSEMTLPFKGKLLDYISNEKLEMTDSNNQLKLTPWEYKIFVH